MAAPTTMASLPAGTVERGRQARYCNVLKTADSRRQRCGGSGSDGDTVADEQNGCDRGSKGQTCSAVTATAEARGLALGYTGCWIAMLSFFATPAGLWCLWAAAVYCTGGLGIDSVVHHPLRMFVLGSVLSATGSMLTFIPFAMHWDRRYTRAPGMRCQTECTWDNGGRMLGRLEVQLTLGNLCLAAMIVAALAVAHAVAAAPPPLGRGRAYDQVYFDVPDPRNGVRPWALLLAETVAFFLWIDLWAYLAHRLLHFPVLYRTYHKLHHRFKQPTAFSALALHPVDMLLLQGGIYVGVCVMPLHIAAITTNLLYVHYHNVLDHSGVYVETWLPWQPSSLYHDDHHRYFHVNYGQSLTFWDRIGGTLYSGKKRYSEKSFSF